MKPSTRHLVYLSLLYRGLALDESHARQVAQSWYGHGRPETSFESGGCRFASDVYCRVWFNGVRSVPSSIRSLIVCDALKDTFDLEGVAGFYFDKVWRLNVDPTRAALLRPYRDERGLIAGLLVFKHLNDTQPRLLTSRGLPRGAKAEPYFPERMEA